MQIRVLATTALAALGLAFAGAAYATDKPTFEDVDANGDGSISQGEAAAIEGLDFAKADANEDGKLSPSEYRTVELSQSTPREGGPMTR